ncbi:MAG: capsule assembly Wzi family protein [Tannerella sp.]|nr:capsule assembly Wzi family protein [Tannerella sp.]
MKQIRWFMLFLALLTGSLCGWGQDEETGRMEEKTDYTMFRIMTSGSLSTKGQMPFWIVSNRYGVVPLKAPNGYLQAGIFHRQPLGSGWEWSAGTDLVAAAPRYRTVYVQQLFGALTYRGLSLSVGSREGERYYNQSLLDSRLSSGDMGISSNARPVPEINLYLARFITLPYTGGWLQGKGNFAVGRSFDSDYLKSFIRPDQFYVKDMLWHHKSIYLRIKDTENAFPFALTLGLRHLVQWGGISTDPKAKVRVQPHSFKDFIRIVLGQSGDANATSSDQVNVLGSHYGTYDFHLDWEKEGLAVKAYHQHFFDDASGMELNNGTDGLWGIQVDFPQLVCLRKVVFERLVTLNQSGPFHFIDYDHTKYPGFGGGGDDYYNNGEYPAGHAYFNRGAGSPLLISPEYNADGTLGFKQTRVRAWHLGAEGSLSRAFSWRILCSRVESFGRPYKPTLKKMTGAFFLTDFSYTFPKAWMLSVSLAVDRGSLTGNHAGCSVSIAKRGLIR